MAISSTTFINGMIGMLSKDDNNEVKELVREVGNSLPNIKPWTEDNVYLALRRLDMKLAYNKYYGKRR